MKPTMQSTTKSRPAKAVLAKAITRKAKKEKPILAPGPTGTEALQAALAADRTSPSARKPVAKPVAYAGPGAPEPLPRPAPSPTVRLEACPAAAAAHAGKPAVEAAIKDRAKNGDASLVKVVPIEELLDIPQFLRDMVQQRKTARPMTEVLEQKREWIMPKPRNPEQAKRAAKKAGGSKSGKIVELCSREKGATMAEVCKAIGRDSQVHIRRHVEKAGQVYSAEKVDGETRYFAKPKKAS